GTAKVGRVDLAANGTLFLDEIGEMEAELQSKLLRFLQDGTYSRIGDVTERSTNARVICANRTDLANEVEKKTFRSDLYHRINVVQLRPPPLRERREDIPELAEYFRYRYMGEFEKDAAALSGSILHYLAGLSWPGNIRELANYVARYVLVGPETPVKEAIAHRRVVYSRARVSGGSVPLKLIASEAIRELERSVILDALRENRWNRRKTAEALKISYRSLIYKIRKAGLNTRGPRLAEDIKGAAAALPPAHLPGK